MFGSGGLFLNCSLSDRALCECVKRPGSFYERTPARLVQSGPARVWAPGECRSQNSSEIGDPHRTATKNPIIGKAREQLLWHTEAIISEICCDWWVMFIIHSLHTNYQKSILHQTVCIFCPVCHHRYLAQHLLTIMQMFSSLSHPPVNCLLGGLRHDFICFETTVKNWDQRDKKKKKTTFKQGHITLIKSDNLDFNVSIKNSNWSFYLPKNPRGLHIEQHNHFKH